MFPSLNSLSRSTLFLDIVAETYTKSGSLSEKLPRKFNSCRPNGRLQIWVIMSSGLPSTTFIVSSTFSLPRITISITHNFLLSGGEAQSVEQLLINPRGRGRFDAHRDLRIFFLCLMWFFISFSIEARAYA